MDDLGQYVLREYASLSRERITLETIWRDAFEFTYPLRGMRFQNKDDDMASTAWNAQNYKATIFDTTGKDAARLLASSLLSGLTPPNMQWFNLVVPETDDVSIPKDAKEWLQKASRVLFKAIHASNYDSEAYEQMIDIVIGGQAGLFIDFIPNEGFKFEFFPMETLFLSEKLNRGAIDTVYRRIQMTAQQVQAKFGDAALDDSMRNQLTNPGEASSSAQQKRHTVIHCIMPRMKGKKQTKGKYAKSMPWMSVWVHKQSGKVLHESGFHEMPIVVPRWHKIPSSNYAWGPVDDALPDIKTLNQVVKLQLTHAEFAIAGMYAIKNDGVINPNTIKIQPRGIIPVADVENIRPFGPAGDFGISNAEVERLQRSIRKVMMSDQLQPQDGPQMTATEVQVRMQIVRQLLGPVYGRFSAEFLAPMITRCFGLALRAGILGEPPESLGGLQFIPEYSSPLARAQKQEDVTAMDQFEVAIANQAQINPEVLDLYDFDRAAKRRADLVGVPEDLLKSDRDVKKVREERAAQMQAQMEAAAQQEEQ